MICMCRGIYLLLTRCLWEHFTTLKNVSGLYWGPDGNIQPMQRWPVRLLSYTLVVVLVSYGSSRRSSLVEDQLIVACDRQFYLVHGGRTPRERTSWMNYCQILDSFHTLNLGCLRSLLQRRKTEHFRVHVILLSLSSLSIMEEYIDLLCNAECSGA